jgi:hypothetical protein
MEQLMQGVTPGRIVHFVLDENVHRPAMMVETWPNIAEYQETGTVNLVVICDGSNDKYHGTDGSLTLWRTSVKFSENKEVGTWHWIEPA